ncbi:MAG: hypothetical protein AVDCRST_MAG79-1729 [uncultured Thermoleophilia bacterium]|uniref:Uncharacterized protein n=1 Tax=uncultured Thermoleophilia bacterium TaxID=1497501 RepID=A0A6J4U3B7_9ACTN|nr:MAG: hypothetical protein AVDCRST_MAG79-1729 [uncultured Thermoleophilia bacterium]
MVEPLRQLFAGESERATSAVGRPSWNIGANVGAFTLWADLRRPGSTIHADEPHPGTFELPERNVRDLSRPWSDVLHVPEYRRELEGDRYGTLILLNRQHNRLRGVGEPVPAPASAPAPEPPAAPASPFAPPPLEERAADRPPVRSEPDSLRAALRPLPRPVRAAVSRRLRRSGARPNP